MQLDGITALVTGAASGLGAATAAALASRGVAVVGLDLPQAVSDPAVSPAPGVRLVGCDVTSEDEVQAALDTIGGDDGPLRLVVNCAGIAPARRILSSKGTHELALFRKDRNPAGDREPDTRPMHPGGAHGRLPKTHLSSCSRRRRIGKS